MRLAKAILSILLPLIMFSLANAEPAIKGRINLSAIRVEDQEHPLTGEWEFYWNKLLTPQDFEIDQHPAWINVPGSWNRQGNYPVLGFATYRLIITLPEGQRDLSLFFPIINASAKVWVNGSLVIETGVVSSDPQLYSPLLRGTLISLPDRASTLDIIVQVANYTYFSGGIAAPPQLAKSSIIFNKMNRVNGIENFFAGSLIALFIYQLILYLLFPRGKPYLWLSLICLGVALRAMIVHGGSFLLPNLLQSVPWEFWKKIEFGSVYAICALFPLYIYHLFPEQAPRRVIWFFVGIASLLCAVVIVTPQYIYGQLLEVCHAMLLLAFVYAVYTVYRAWKEGNSDARIILIGVLASFPFILAEILKNSSFRLVDFEFMYLVELGVLVFLMFQVYLLASHYAKSYKNLETLNQNLERIVEERTGQLVTANSVKDRLLSVMSHDIKSPLNSLQGILQLYNKGSISSEEFGSFAKRIEDDLSKTGMLVENILYWTASQLKGVQVNLEQVDVNLLVEENIRLFKTIAENKKIAVNYSKSPIHVKTDRNILNLVLRNLLANAIKFSFEGGTIDILAKESQDFVLIDVTDHGTGMDNEKIQSLMSPKTTVSSSGTTQEKGTGLGLALCREYLQNAGGVLTIRSEKGKGSTFTISLPN